MNAARIAALTLVAWLSSGCAIFNAAKGGNFAAAAEAAKKEAALMAESKKYGDTECDPIKTSELSWEEERAVPCEMCIRDRPSAARSASASPPRAATSSSRA